MDDDVRKAINLLGGLAEDYCASSGLLIRDLVKAQLGDLTLSVQAYINEIKQKIDACGPDEDAEKFLLMLAAYGASVVMIENMRRCDLERDFPAE